MRPGPRRTARRAAACVQPTMVSDIGTNVSPACSDEKPSTCWTYSDTRNHIETAVPPRHRPTTAAPDSARVRKIRGGTSGNAARRASISQKTPSTAAPAAIGASVVAAPQPWRWAATMPYVRSTSPEVTASAPGRSNARAAPGRRPSRGTTRHETTDRQRRRRHDGASEALGGAGGDERHLVGRQPAGERGQPEQREAAGEHLATSEQVLGATAEQQDPGARERIAVDHPLQPGGREPQVRADRRQRDVDDRHVEQAQELAETAAGEDQHARQDRRRRTDPHRENGATSPANAYGARAAS
jgi:hypothetical protein